MLNGFYIGLLLWVTLTGVLGFPPEEDSPEWDCHVHGNQQCSNPMTTPIPESDPRVWEPPSLGGETWWTVPVDMGGTWIKVLDPSVNITHLAIYA